MAQHDTAHGAPDGEHQGVHLPDPSIWPLVVGLAFGLVGGALIWWQRAPDSDLALIAMGAAAAFALLAAAGWAYEDGKMRAKAEEGGGHGERLPRYNQLITFALAEGSLAASRAAGGVLPEIEDSAAAMHDVDGFQDFRITVSPAESGPSQVVVETTWSGREQLAAYNEGRETILDILARHDEQVVPGSVQAFDMEVIRDTKDTAFRFGWAAATTIFGSLLVLGFMIGAGLTLFESEGVATGGGDGTPPPASDPYEVIAEDTFFPQETLEAPPNTEVTFTLINEGVQPHNLSFYESENGTLFVEGEIISGGETTEVTFTTPGEGEYFFRCDVHPQQMTGTLVVTADAPPPGGAPPAGEGGGSDGGTITADNLEFDTDQIEATAGQPFSITLNNEDDTFHNISFYDQEGGELLDPAAEGENVRGGETGTVSFTPAEAGTFYFQCDLHPDMNGDFVVAG